MAELENETVAPTEVDAPQQEAEALPGAKAWDKVVDKITYKGMVRNMPYLIFLALLAIIYIANNNHAIALVRAIDHKKKELKELRWRYMDLQSRLMYQTSESQLKLKTAELGLKPLKEPAFEIKIIHKPTEDK